MEPDLDALLAAYRALFVIFIILISLANLLLIVKQVRKPLFYQNVKAMIIFSLAIGDLLLALFPLVVMAKVAYSLDLSWMTCRTSTAIKTYMYYLIHFVYGFGLVTLGAEVLFRQKIYAVNIHKGIIALFASSFPWILGLVIILPLCLAKVNFENRCENSQSVESMFGVAVFFPASLAVFVTVILSCILFSKQGSKQFINPDQPQTDNQPQQLSIQQLNPYINSEPPTKEIHIHEKGQLPGHQEGEYPFPRNQLGVYQYPSNQQGVYQYPSSQLGVYQYPSNQPGVYQYPSNQQGECQYHISSPGVHPYPINQLQKGNTLLGNDPPKNPADVTTSSIKREVRMLLIIAIVFFIMVVPIAVLALNINTIAWPDTMTALAVYQVFNWLMMFRSFLTPLMMLQYSDL